MQKRDQQLYKMKLALLKGIMLSLAWPTLDWEQRLDQEGIQQIKQFGFEALSLPVHVNYKLQHAED